jgi:Rrf2 family protein
MLKSDPRSTSVSYSLAFSQAIAITVFVAAKVEACQYDFVPTKELAETLNIAPPTAVKIIHSLSSVGLIETREGAKGGVRLAKTAAEITLLDVFNAVEQQRPLFRFDSALRISDEKQERVKQAIFKALGHAKKAMHESLATTTIADLYRVNLNS